jgi:hypothetical protein
VSRRKGFVSCAPHFLNQRPLQWWAFSGIERLRRFGHSNAVWGISSLAGWPEDLNLLAAARPPPEGLNGQSRRVMLRRMNYTKPLIVRAPPDLAFEDAMILRHPAGTRVLFRMDPIRVIATVSGVPPEELDQRTATTILALWYDWHLQHGGSHDPVADAWLLEVGYVPLGQACH